MQTTTQTTKIMDKTVPFFSSTPPDATAKTSPRSSAYSDHLRKYGKSPQTSQFTRILDLVTEHEKRSTDQDVKIAELTQKLATLSERMNGSSVSTSVSTADVALNIKDDIAGLTKLVQKLNKSVTLLAQENEITRKRQNSFMNQVQNHVGEIQREVDVLGDDVKALKNSARESAKHIKHQCKKFITENFTTNSEKSDKSATELEAAVKAQLSQMDAKMHQASEFQEQRHKHELENLQERVDKVGKENAELTSKVASLVEGQGNFAASTREMDDKLASFSKDLDEAKGTTQCQATLLGDTRKDLINTQRHLIDRTKDLKQLLKKVSHVVHAKERHGTSSTALKSAQLYNSWRTSLFTYSPQRDQENRNMNDFDSFMRKLKQRLRDSERTATQELGLFKQQDENSTIENLL